MVPRPRLAPRVRGEYSEVDTGTLLLTESHNRLERRPVQLRGDYMAITPAQQVAAESVQLTAAQDPAPQVMVVAGPETGKNHAILMRVAMY